MKTNRIFVLAFACLTLLSTGSVFAQSSVTNASGAGTPGSKGFVAGLVYSNLSDLRTHSESKTYIDGVKTRDRNETFTSGIHAGLMGLHLGYKDIYASGTWGVSAGLQVLRGLNGSETPSRLTLYKIVGDVVLPVTDYLVLSAGLNASYLGGLSEGDNKVYPGIGAQVGTEIRMNHVGLLIGAQVISASTESTFTDSNGGSTYKYESKSSFIYSGVITQLSYTF